MNPLDSAGQKLKQAGISTDLEAKWRSLTEELASYSSAVVAFSGGVDSSFLAYAAFLALGERMLAITIRSSVDTPQQLELSTRFAAKAGFKQVVLPFEPLDDPLFRTNPPDRCYHCKTAILKVIWDYARSHQVQVVMEGQNADDRGDYRPGSRAVLESGTLSPLAKHELTKAEIRWLSRALELSTWDMPSSPCLATRFPYGTQITPEGLNRVAAAEAFLHEKGFHILRVRSHGDLARIEVLPEQVPQLVEMRSDVADYFKKIGFLYVSLDLQGYRSGSMNEGLIQ
jgi:uncharacterized protein